jgi:hypothetical protein
MFCGCSSQTKEKIERHKAIQTEIEKEGTTERPIEIKQRNQQIYKK